MKCMNIKRKNAKCIAEVFAQAVDGALINSCLFECRINLKYM